MNENIKWFAAAAAVVGLSLGAVVYFSQGKKALPSAAPVVAAPAPKPLPDPDAIRHPIAAPDKQAALPSLEDSDGTALIALAGLIGTESVARFVVTKDLVRHIVVTVDNLPEQKVAERLRPVLPVSGKLVVGGTEDAPVLDAANFDRYKPAVQVFRSADSKRLAATYARYYPLFQQSYEDLGHPPKYFNDRVIQVIDHLLQTPDVPGPIALAQPNVQYEFADPKLEALSAGQKVLIRMGSENATAVKAKLRELRGVLAEQKP